MRQHRFLALLLAGLLVASVSLLTAADKQKSAEGYDVRLSADAIELVFPDGSVLTTPRDFDGKSLDQLTATAGMAKELLDEAYEQLGAQQPSTLPKSYSLAQNTPNPFNPSTTISYTVPEGAGQVEVKLTVFNLRGQELTRLVSTSQGPGSYTVNWNGDDSAGRQLSSGVYFYRMQAGDYVATRKMVLLK